MNGETVLGFQFSFGSFGTIFLKSLEFKSSSSLFCFGVLGIALMFDDFFLKSKGIKGFFIILKSIFNLIKRE